MNMSYCMFENTSLAMRQLLQATQEADSLRDMDLSRDELRALRELVEQCEHFMDEVQRLDDGDQDQREDHPAAYGQGLG
jgi:hypothetical protein